MDFEDIISGIVVVVIAIMSIISRLIGRANERAKQAAKAQQLAATQDVGRENAAHPDSAEQIFEEVAGFTQTYAFAEYQKVKKREKKEHAKNATNRTSKKLDTKMSAESQSGAAEKKFNLRDAVIYSEILAPKFKEEDR